MVGKVSWSSAAMARRIGAVDVGLGEVGALLQDAIEVVERAARLLGGHRAALDVSWLPRERMSTPSFCSSLARFSSNCP